jgi:hypothetical protein
MADDDALEYLARQKASTASTSTKMGATAADRAVAAKSSESQKHRFPGLFPTIYPIIGSPDDIAAEI